MSTRTLLILVSVLAFWEPSCSAQETTTKAAVNFCDIVRNPTAYEGKEISIRAKVSDEFEDFTLFDSACYEQPDIWIELGGDLQCKDKWEGMDFVCNPRENLKFRGVEYPITRDESLETFLKLLGARKGKKSVHRVTATLTGTFFGENPKQDEKLRAKLPGYGHMGCCFQLIVNRVSNVTSTSDVQDRDDELKKRFNRHPDKKLP